MIDLDDMLKSRHNLYGDYREGIVTRARIMSTLCGYHKRIHGRDIDAEHEQMILDVVNKLVRAAVNPTYKDNWVDIIGYSTRILEALEEQDMEDIEYEKQ